MVNNWKGCDDCGCKTRNTRIFRGKFLCARCFRKNITIIPGSGQIYDEPLNKQMMCSVVLTKTQEEKLYKRLKYLYPQYNRRGSRLHGLSGYLRSLILSDIAVSETHPHKFKKIK